jgi:hypothetical protein
MLYDPICILSVFYLLFSLQKRSFHYVSTQSTIESKATSFIVGYNNQMF